MGDPFADRVGPFLGILVSRPERAGETDCDEQENPDGEHGNAREAAAVEAHLARNHEGQRREQRQQVERKARTRDAEDQQRHDDPQEQGQADRIRGPRLGVSPGLQRSAERTDPAPQRQCPRQRADHQGRQIDFEPAVPFAMAAEVRRGDPINDLAAEEIVEQASGVAHHDDVPGQGDHGEHEQARPVEDRRGTWRRQQPDRGDDGEQRQKRGWALDQEAEGEADPHQQHPAPRTLRIVEARFEPGHHGHAEGRAEQEIGGHHLRRPEGQEHRRVDQGGLVFLAGHDAPGDSPDHPCTEQVGQRIRQPRRPRVVAEHADAGRDHPVGQRWFGPVADMFVAHRMDPVAALEHVQGDVGVAPFIGVPERARTEEGERKQEHDGRADQQRGRGG